MAGFVFVFPFIMGKRTLLVTRPVASYGHFSRKSEKNVVFYRLPEKIWFLNFPSLISSFTCFGVVGRFVFKWKSTAFTLHHINVCISTRGLGGDYNGDNTQIIIELNKRFGQQKTQNLCSGAAWQEIGKTKRTYN